MTPHLDITDLTEDEQRNLRAFIDGAGIPSASDSSDDTDPFYSAFADALAVETETGETE